MDNERCEEPEMQRNKAELEPAFAELAAALQELRATPGSEESQCNVCLLTRSAFTDFYSVSVLQGKADEWAVHRLNQLFSDALNVLPSGKYQESVERRYRDFDAFCDDIHERTADDTALPHLL